MRDHLPNRQIERKTHKFELAAAVNTLTEIQALQAIEATVQFADIQRILRNREVLDHGITVRNDGRRAGDVGRLNAGTHDAVARRIFVGEQIERVVVRDKRGDFVSAVNRLAPCLPLREGHGLGNVERDVIDVAMLDARQKQFPISCHGNTRNIDILEVDPRIEAGTEYLLVALDRAAQHMVIDNRIEVAILLGTRARLRQTVVEKRIAVRCPCGQVAEADAIDDNTRVAPVRGIDHTQNSFFRPARGNADDHMAAIGGSHKRVDGKARSSVVERSGIEQQALGAIETIARVEFAHRLPRRQFEIKHPWISPLAGQLHAADRGGGGGQCRDAPQQGFAARQRIERLAGEIVLTAKKVDDLGIVDILKVAVRIDHRLPKVNFRDRLNCGDGR